MARAFSVETEEQRFRLPRATREQIAALMDDLDTSARDVVIQAVAQLHQRELGQPDRDLAADVDNLFAAVAAIAREMGMKDGKIPDETGKPIIV